MVDCVIDHASVNHSPSLIHPVWFASLLGKRRVESVLSQLAPPIRLPPSPLIRPPSLSSHSAFLCHSEAIGGGIQAGELNFLAVDMA